MNGDVVASRDWGLPVRGWSPRAAAGPPAPGPPPPAADFSAMLRDAAARPASDAAAAPRSAQLTAAASQLVSSAFIMPVLQALRDSPFNDGPLAPGAAERRFMPLLDQHLADRVAQASGFALVDVIVKRLSRPEAAQGGMT
jgi:Rod binding domain-containing protein